MSNEEHPATEELGPKGRLRLAIQNAAAALTASAFMSQFRQTEKTSRGYARELLDALYAYDEKVTDFNSRFSAYFPCDDDPDYPCGECIRKEDCYP